MAAGVIGMYNWEEDNSWSMKCSVLPDKNLDKKYEEHFKKWK